MRPGPANDKSIALNDRQLRSRLIRLEEITGIPRVVVPMISRPAVMSVTSVTDRFWPMKTVLIRSRPALTSAFLGEEKIRSVMSPPAMIWFGFGSPSWVGSALCNSLRATSVVLGRMVGKSNDTPLIRPLDVCGEGGESAG